jgi:DNA-directed RNA polymerase specialized sigma24 family protein
MLDAAEPLRNAALSDTDSFAAVPDVRPSVVERALAGDPAGHAELYDGYATALYTYCYNVLGDQDRAIGALGITFMIAANRLTELRSVDRLRPWLYTLARNECRRRAADQGGQPGSSAAGWVPGGQQSRADVVRMAVRSMSLPDREVLELSLRHHFVAADLADVLGIPGDEVYATVTQAGSRLRQTVSAFLLVDAGRPDCPDLDAMLAGWRGPHTALLSQRVHRHTEWCTTCRVRAARELPPGSLTASLAMLAPPPMPEGMRGDVLALLAEVPGGTSDADLIVGRVERGYRAQSGDFPRTAKGSWRPAGHPLAVAGVVAGVLVTVVLVVYLLRA